ncbi:hypothetical protein AMTRI_Chr13g124730 [Amborella trichopoda]
MNGRVLPLSPLNLSTHSLSFSAKLSASLCIHRNLRRPTDLAPWPSTCLCVLFARSVLAAKLYLSAYSLSSLCIHRDLRKPADLSPCCYNFSLLLKPLGAQKLSPIQGMLTLSLSLWFFFFHLSLWFSLFSSTKPPKPQRTARNLSTFVLNIPNTEQNLGNYMVFSL